MGRRILGFIYLGTQAWWHRFLLAGSAGKLFWGLVPLLGACAFCALAAAPFAESQPTATPRVAVASTIEQPASAPTDAEVIASIAASEPTALPTPQPATAAAHTPASDAAALLPPAQSTEQLAATEPPAPSPTTPAVETVAPPPAATRPPRAQAAGTANMRDQPTAEGSTVIGGVTEGEALELRRRTPDGTWYAVETPGGLIGWVSASLLTVPPELAAALPIGTTDDAIAVRPTVAPLSGSGGEPIPTAVDMGAAPCQPGQIKGNRNSDIYHAPGQRDYERTYANVQCFDTEAEAQAAGYRRAQR